MKKNTELLNILIYKLIDIRKRHIHEHTSREEELQDYRELAEEAMINLENNTKKPYQLRTGTPCSAKPYH